MKKVICLIVPVCFMTCFAVLNSCNEKEEEPTITPVVPITDVVTKPVSAISSTYAITGGDIGDNGGALSMFRGLCWNTESDPDTSSFYIDETVVNPGSFTYRIGPLLPSTTYYVRAFAANEAGITYGDNVIFTTNASLSDIEGRTYGITNIGTQVWMTEDLATTKYNDGTSIPLVNDRTDWNILSGPGYFLFSSINLWCDCIEPVKTLYNWYSVNTEKLCPVGWHVPTDVEWLVLAIYVGPEILCSYSIWGNLEQTYSNSYIFNAGNTVILDTIDGIKGWKNYGAELTPQWWSSNSSGNYSAWYFILNPKIMRLEYSKKYGLPVRCIKD